jgi:hypothetical protein
MHRAVLAFRGYRLDLLIPIAVHRPLRNHDD